MKTIKILLGIFFLILSVKTQSSDDLDKIFMKVVREYAEKTNNKVLAQEIDEAVTVEDRVRIVECMQNKTVVVGHGSKNLIIFYKDLLEYAGTDYVAQKLTTVSSTSGPGWTVGNGGEDDRPLNSNFSQRNNRGLFVNTGTRVPASINSTKTGGPGWVIGNGGDDDHIMDLGEVRSVLRSMGI